MTFERRDGLWLLILTYLGPLAVIPALSGRASDFARWHAKQGLVLFVSEVVLLTTTSLVGALLSYFIGAFVLVFTFAMVALVTFLLFLHGILTVAAMTGERVALPGVGRFVDTF